MILGWFLPKNHLKQIVSMVEAGLTTGGSGTLCKGNVSEDGIVVVIAHFVFTVPMIWETFAIEEVG